MRAFRGRKGTPSRSRSQEISRITGIKESKEKTVVKAGLAAGMVVLNAIQEREMTTSATLIKTATNPVATTSSARRSKK